MVEQILLSSVSFDGVRERGGFGQPLHALYPQIRAVLASELGSDTADLLAEPVVDRVHNRIDWYTEGDPDQPPVALSTLPEEQRQATLGQVYNLLERGRQVAERYTTSGDVQRIQLGAILKAVLSPPAETDVFLVNGRPVVAHWGFASDHPWGASGVSIRGPFASSDPPSALQSAAGESPPLPEPSTESAPPELPPEAPPKESAEPPAVVLAKSAPPPLPAASPSSVVENQGTALRYVVVGSWYFWSVVILALLLALGAAFWNRTHSGARSLTGEAAPQLPDAALDRALADARQAEQALRRRLEERLAALAEQRGRCSLPVGTDTTSMPSTPLTPSVPSIPSTPSDPSAGSTPPTSAAPITAPATPEPTVTDAALTSPVEPGVRDAVQPEAAPSVTGSRRSPIVMTPELTAPSAGEPVARAFPLTTPATPEPTVPAMGKPVARTLEEELGGSQPSAVASPLAEPASEPPVLAEPTPEERQEFTSRLSATGAATGEITASLLWDGNADLDLVVRCPSGQTLDYLTPRGCGGTLDVDANAARDSLSGKPVENIFWPAGQATPGAYKIAVRYEPRKDERNPQPVPFQVRLIRDSQEQVFKGTIRPRRTLPIANFTVVER